MNEILIYDAIGAGFFDESITAKTIKDQLDSFNNEDVAVRINSPGGDVFDGFAIYNLLNQYQGNVTVHIDGLAASAASIIAMAGNEILMAENGLMMIHNPWSFAIGSASEMRDTADLLDKIRDSIVTTYHAKTGVDKEEIAEMMANETWLNAEESIEKGFATDTAENQAAAFNFNKQWIKNAPKPEIISNDIGTQAAYKVAINRRKLSLLD